MRRVFFPAEEYGSVYDIPFDRLYGSGVRGVIFDIDNTLVRHGHPADERSVLLFRRLHELGMKTCLISNNHLERVAPFAEAVRSPFSCDAGKPLPAGYRRALAETGTKREETVFIGDQVFTDILGGNLAGIRTILVRPIGGDPGLWLKAKRVLERPLLSLYRKRRKRRA